MSDTLNQLAELNGTIGGAEPIEEPQLPTGVVEPVVEDPAPEAEPAQVFEVDGQKFADEKTAFDYLKKRNTELEAERMVEAARIETMQEMMRHNGGQVTQQVADQVSKADDFDETAFYANPAEYLANERKKLREEVLQEVTSKQTQAQRDAQVWNGFTERHPELADLRDVVELVTEQNTEVVSALARKDIGKAYDYVATKVKEKFQNYVEAAKPGKILPSTKGGVSSGVTAPVTSQQKNNNQDKPLDFIQQVKQHRNR